MPKDASRVAIVGDGLAACVAIRSLRSVDMALHVYRSDSISAVPVILNELAIALVSNVLEVGVLGGAHELRRRGVCWGTESPIVIEQPSLAMRGAVFRLKALSCALKTLGRNCEVNPATEGSDSCEGWKLSSLAASTLQRLGSRTTLVAEVALEKFTDTSMSFMEACPRGWLFFAPLSDRHATLQATFASLPSRPLEDLLEILTTSRYISTMVVPEFHEINVLPSSPGLDETLATSRVLKTGTGGASLDPVCGDGTSFSIRSGLLAAAVVRASANGIDERHLLSHYNERHRRAFRAHLRTCEQLYSQYSFDASWMAELDEIVSAPTMIELDEVLDNSLILRDFDLFGQ